MQEEMRRIAYQEAERVADEKLSPIRDTLWGEEHPAGGGLRKTEEGMQHKLDKVYELATNGGFPSKLQIDRRTKIEVALIGTIPALIGFVTGLLTAS